MFTSTNSFKLVLVIFFFLHNYILAQEPVYVADSIMNAYMKSGYSNEHFMPSGKTDKSHKRQGKWKDYEVTLDYTFVTIDDIPTKVYAVYLLYAEGLFKDNKRIGKWDFYVIEDKTFKHVKQKTIYYENGSIEGKCTYYHINKKTASTSTFLKNERTGKESVFFETGELFREKNYVNGKQNGTSVTFYKGGEIYSKYNYVEDSLDGPSIHFYENGKTKEECFFKNGALDGTYKYFYPNGQLWVERLYDNGLMLEIVGSYAPDGSARNKGTLVNGTGTVNYYTEDGKLYHVKTLENGTVVKTEDF